MIAASPTTADWWMLIGILILLGILMVLSIAEMGLSRVSKPKAQALADSGARGNTKHDERSPLYVGRRSCTGSNKSQWANTNCISPLHPV